MRSLSSFMVMALMAYGAWAMVIDARLADPAQEATAQHLFHELRCVVCEGQSLAESDAAFAQQMRAEVRRRIRAGEDFAAVKDYFVQQYGTEILQRPPLGATTVPLWAMPLILLLIGAWFMRPQRSRGKQ
jgi:cytochrome c-type biogenesis protein CcmH